MAASNGEGDLRHVDVSVRVDRYPVRRDESSRLLALLGVSEARKKLTLAAEDADSMPQAWSVIHAGNAVQLAYVYVAIGSDGQSIGPVDVVPHGDEFPVTVEHLDPMAFSVCDVNPIFRIDGKVMWPDELASVHTRLTP